MNQTTAPEEHGRRGWVGPVALFVLVAALVIVTHRCRNRSLVSAHGLLHAAVAHEAVAGGVPPDNPFAAHTALPYYWVYQTLAGLVSRGLGVHPLRAFEILNLIGLGLFVGGLAWLGRRLFSAWWPGLLAAMLGLTAANPFGVGFLLARVLAGDVDLSLQADPTVHIHPSYRALYLDDFRYGSNLVYFLNVTSRGLALGLAATIAALVDRFLARPAGRVWVVAAMASLILGLMNPLLGVALAAALAPGLAWVWFRAGTGPAGGASMPGRKIPAIRVALVFLAVLLGQAAAYPSWSGAASNLSTAVAWLVSPDRLPLSLLRVSLAGGPLFLLAWLGSRRSRLAGAPRSLWLLVSGGVLLIAPIAIRLPAGNEHNLFQLATVCLAVPAARTLVRSDRPDRPARGAVWLAALLFLPSTGLQVAAYWHREPAPIRLEADRVVFPDRPAHQAALDWLYAHTSPRAVILDTAWADVPRPPVHQNVSVVPAATGRRLFVDRLSYVVPDRPESHWRLGLAFRLYCGEPWTERQWRRVAAFPDPLYVLTTSPAGRDRALRTLGHQAQVVHQNDRMAVLRLDLAR